MYHLEIARRIPGNSTERMLLVIRSI